MDYSTAILNVIWALAILGIDYTLPFSINFKIGFFIILYFPLLLFSIIGFNNENIIYVLSYLIKFAKNRTIYFYGKDWQIVVFIIEL